MYSVLFFHTPHTPYILACLSLPRAQPATGTFPIAQEKSPAHCSPEYHGTGFRNLISSYQQPITYYLTSLDIKTNKKLITGWEVSSLTSPPSVIIYFRIAVTANCYALAFASAVAGLQIVEKTITSRIMIYPKDLQTPERSAAPREHLVLLWLFCGWWLDVGLSPPLWGAIMDNDCHARVGPSVRPKGWNIQQLGHFLNSMVFIRSTTSGICIRQPVQQTN